jgi:FkbH-like protein
MVWDLDETIWKGRLLEGDNPRLRPGIVEVLRKLDSRGVLLSIASTNDHDQAWAHLKRFGIADLFLAPEINLGSKHHSVSRIAASLDLKFSHIGFIDDDPLERELVTKFFGGSVHIFNAVDYLTLPDDPRLSPAVISRDGHKRRELVGAELRRQDEKAKYETWEGFLYDCEIKFSVRLAEQEDLDRVLELAVRTNRMNASGRRYTVEEVSSILADRTRTVMVGALQDRFGDYGTVCAAILQWHDSVAKAEALWISCRVAKRGVPPAFVSALGMLAHTHGAVSLEVSYSPTEANRLAAFYLGTYGFKLETSEGEKCFRLHLPLGIRPYPAWMTII